MLERPDARSTGCSPRRASLVIAALATLSACADDPLTRLTPRLEVEPEALDFGEGVVDFDNVLVLSIRNLGDGPLEVSAIELDAGVFSAPRGPFNVAPRRDHALPVTFRPRLAHEVSRGSLTIVSNDAARPRLEVPLDGIGGVREIEVFPAELDFGTVNEGTSPRRAVEVRNLGKDPLLISAVTFTSTSVDLALAGDTFRGGVIPALTSTVVELVYAPVDLGADLGVLEIRSNDEDEPAIEVPVRGRANLAPRALAFACEKPQAPGAAGCDGEEQLRALTAGFRRIVGLEGRASYDPEGGAISDYRWVIVERPPSSSATVFFSTADLGRRRATGDIEIDRVGRYDLRLIAKDDRGLESLDREESHVFILPRDLEILLRWDVATDVDLHLVRPGGRLGDYGSGATGTSTGADCSAFNRRPNWMDLTTDADDPSLDKDDVTGRGPEIVSLDRPEAGGVYQVFVHYCDSRMNGFAAGVTVEVYVRGALLGTIPESGTFALASGEVWRAADLVWDDAGPTVEVTPGTDAPRADPGLCLLGD